jgi:iron complex outermembrane receptor protein
MKVAARTKLSSLIGALSGGVTASLLLCSSSGVVAQQTAGPDQLIEEVVTIGTRTKGRTAEDLPVPVDVLNAEALTNTGQTEVGRML